MSNQIASLLLAVSDFIEPLTESFGSLESLEYLFYRFGWRVVLDDSAFGQVKQVAAVATAAQKFADVADPLRERLASNPDSDLSIEDIGHLSDAAANLFQTIAAFKPASLDHLPPPLNSADAWETLGEQLFDSLLEQYLRVYHPTLYLVLLCSGCIRYDRVPADGDSHVTYTRVSVDWTQLQAMLTDPVAALKHAYHWGDPGAPFDYARLLDALTRVLRSVHVSVDVLTPSLQLDPGLAADVVAQVRTDVDALRATLLHDVVLGTAASYEVGFDLLPAARTGETVPSGLILRPRLIGSADQPISLGETVSLKFSLTANAGDALGVAFFPGKTSLTGGAVTLGAAVEIAASRPQPWYLIGNARTSRIEVHNPSVRFSLEGALEDPELRLRLGTAAADGQAGCSVIIPMDDSDAFVKDAVNQDAIQLALAPEILWSSKTGFAFSGRPTPDLNFPLSIGIGAFTLRDIRIGLTQHPEIAGKPAFLLRVGLTIAGSIGPVDVVLQGVGFACQITPYGRQDLLALPPEGPRPVLGNLGIDLHFADPTGVGLSIDTQGVLSGGGFLFHDPAQGVYAGVLQLTFQDQLTLTAFGLIATRMPDGSRGYSLLIFITAEGFEPIPLGFGFVLESIGGIVAVNRTFDQDALKAGLQTDSLAALLFPSDPVANAPAIIQALSTAFPARRDSYLLGLLARITWFRPVLVQLDLALILELGARNRLLALARATSLLPSADDEQIRLKLDALGVLDFDAGTLACNAVLVDSRLARQFPITGSAALRASWSGSDDGSGTFVLAAGGLNPRFTPPTGFPTLERVAIALCSGSNPQLVCDAYLAITADTVQFGARTSLYAEALGFSVVGDLGFDALITLLPPHFIVDFHASVQLKRGSHNLFKVTLDGTLEGPLPLRLAAKATFEIFWISFSVHFDFTLATGDVAQAVLPAVALVSELASALADPASWSTRRPNGLSHGVALRSLPTSAGQVLDPLGQLVVKQQVAPLNTGRDVDTVAGAPVAGALRFQLQATLNGVAGTPTQGAFAPARYFRMSDDEKLTAPSFELMDAGVVVGDGAATFAAGTVVPADLTYESIVLDALTPAGASGSPTPAPQAAPKLYTLPVEALARHTPSGAAARVPARSVGRARFQNASVRPAARLRAPEWRIVQATDGAVAPNDPRLRTWSEYRAALASLNRGGARWLMMPRHELDALQRS